MDFRLTISQNYMSQFLMREKEQERSKKRYLSLCIDLLIGSLSLENIDYYRF